MTTAALYLRSSSNHQKYTTTAQAAALRQYAETHALVIGRVYEDDGYSGLTLKGRPALRELLKDALSPGRLFDVLLVYDVSRWGRYQDADEGAHYEFLCRRAGVRVVYCAEPFENEIGAVANIMKSIKRTMAAEYSRELSVKVTRAQRRLAERGTELAKPSFGLRRMVVDQYGQPGSRLETGHGKNLRTDKTILVPGPSDEIALVRYIFRKFGLDHWGCTKIARALCDRGALTSKGIPWSRAAVRRVLQNEAYIGNFVFGRTSTGPRFERIAAPEQNWIRHPGVFENIVPCASFTRVQRRMASESRHFSDEQFLSLLKTLWDQEGYLNSRLINRQPNMPTATAYVCRFGGLVKAYRLIGYISPHEHRTRRTGARDREPDRAEMLRQLKSMLDREGRLTSALIKRDPTMPPPHAYKFAFGGLPAAYRLIGYDPLLRTPLSRPLEG